jgi:hypothetical protein
MKSVCFSTLFIICIALGVATPAPAESSLLPLFHTARESADRSPLSEAVLRSRWVDPQLKLIREADTLWLNLFDDADLTARRERVEARSPEDFTWFGTLDDVAGSLVIFTVRKGTLAGYVRYPGALYRIRRVGSTAHEIRQIDPESFLPEAPPLEVPDRAVDSSASATRAADSGDVIDVLVVYTPAAAAAIVDIEVEIQLTMDAVNQAYANSGVLQRVRLVHTREIAYVESGDGSTDLNRLQNPTDGFMDEVHPWREDYCADTVQLWNDGMESCGRAFVLTDEGATFEEYAFSVVWRTCAVDNLTAAHELGHNMGGRHDRFNQPAPGAFEYSHGYRNPSIQDRWRTVMAVLFGERLPYFSNPEISYNGAPMGVPEGDPESADMRKSLNNTASLVANFRASDACALEVPDQTVRVDKDLGSDVAVSWGADCGTAWDYTIYEGDLDLLVSTGTYDHESVVCSDVGADLTETVTPEAGSRYFLVVPRSQPGIEGNYGPGRPQGTDPSGCGITGQRPGSCL